jgi:hypothetical protein
MVKPFGIRPVGSIGRCSNCRENADVEALFSLDGSIVAKYYCSACLDEAEYGRLDAPIRLVH